MEVAYDENTTRSAIDPIASSLPPVSPPGLAMLPTQLSSYPQTLIMKGEYLSRSYTISTTSNQPLYTISSQNLSMSHRKDVFDASGRPLMQIRKSGFGTSKYHGEDPQTGTQFFSTESHFSFSGRKSSITFNNAVDGRRMVTLDCKYRMSEGDITCGNARVAVIEKKFFKMRTEYHLHVAAGLDPLVVVALTVVLDDAQRTRNGNAAAASGSAS